jgi:hypothetical protein
MHFLEADTRQRLAIAPVAEPLIVGVIDRFI